MLNSQLKTLSVYVFLIFFISAWWTFAFQKKVTSDENSFSPRFFSQSKHHSLQIEPAITHIDRNLLQQALSGDTRLMARLIADWDIDAQILSSNGFQDVSRLNPSDFLRSQSLIRLLQNQDYAKNATSILKQQNQHVVDDTGNYLNLKPIYKKFLPQTYVAASFLLSLIPPEHIVALPRSLRDQTQLYPLSLTEQIPLDIDRYNAEKLFQAGTDLAFVAHYSHPATIQALSNQGVLLYTMKNIQSLEDISHELIATGHITGRPLQAELLKIFIDAAMCAMDNHQAALVGQLKKNHTQLPRILVVNFHQTFSVPTIQTLAGQIISRMPLLNASLQLASDNNQANEWVIPLGKERLLNMDPEILVITTTNPDAAAKRICSDKSLRDLSAVRNQRLIFVDEAVQQSPSQYILLAYHDLIQALKFQP